jgi:hypothetical protein
MSVSSVSSPPVTVVVPSYDTTRQDDQTKAQSQDSDPTTQPTPPAPLPPGQGTRIDQLA